MSAESNYMSNSLLYKAMYSKERKNFDALLRIASKCKMFSLSHFFLSFDDIV